MAINNITVVIALFSVTNTIDFLFNPIWNFADPRTTEWPLMQSPIPTIMMVVIYLYVILIAGPKMMENRKPLHLRETLIVYNGAQVLYSSYMLYEVSNFYYKQYPLSLRIYSFLH